MLQSASSQPGGQADRVVSLCNYKVVGQYHAGGSVHGSVQYSTVQYSKEAGCREQSTVGNIQAPEYRTTYCGFLGGWMQAAERRR
jgi:hypothetical protein